MGYRRRQTTLTWTQPSTSTLSSRGLIFLNYISDSFSGRRQLARAYGFRGFAAMNTTWAVTTRLYLAAELEERDYYKRSECVLGAGSGPVVPSRANAKQVDIGKRIDELAQSKQKTRR